MCRAPACAEPGCTVSAWNCHRPGCANRVSEDRQAKGQPARYCSRSCAGKANAGRRWGPVTQSLLATTGACGVPGCAPDCPVPAGHCHRDGCEQPARLAASTERTVPCVRGYPLRHCSRSCQKRDDEHARALGTRTKTEAARIQASLRAGGLVPLAAASKLTSRSRKALVGYGGRNPHVPVIPVATGNRIRLAVDSREVFAIATDLHARGKLAVPLAVRNGTERVGRPSALSDAEVELVLTRRSGGAGWRTIKAELNAARPPERAVSHMAVKRAVERATISTASAV